MYTAAVRIRIARMQKRFKYLIFGENELVGVMVFVIVMQNGTETRLLGWIAAPSAPAAELPIQGFRSGTN